MEMEGVEEFKPNKKKRNPFADGEKNDSSSGEEKLKRPIIKSVTDLQRLKLEKLMKNPEKPIIIPELPREKDYLKTVPNFVRNVLGSSAGAGSGEFHVYRHLRRKEYARQKYMKIQTTRDQLDAEFQEKLERNRLNAEEKTAKKRAKRLKKKQKQKQKGKKPKTENPTDNKVELSDSENSSDENENDDCEKMEVNEEQKIMELKPDENKLKINESSDVTAISTDKENVENKVSSETDQNDLKNKEPSDLNEIATNKEDEDNITNTNVGKILQTETTNKIDGEASQ